MQYIDKLIFKTYNSDFTWQYNNKLDCICCNISNKIFDLTNLNYENIKTAYINQGFFNIQLKDSVLLNYLKYKETENHTIHIEHTSANPVGRLHIGNLRNTYFGDCLKRLHKYRGNKVITEYYINDLGNACAASILCYLKHPNIDLDKLYLYYITHKEEFNPTELKQIVHTIETSQKYYEILKKITSFNLDLIIKDLKQFGVEIDEFIYESSVQNRTAQLIDNLKEKFIIDKQLIYYESEKGVKDIIRRSDGSYTYIARDIVHTIEKLNQNYDEYHTVVGQDHQLFKTTFLNLLSFIINKPITNFKIDVIKFINFESEKMSKRKNNLLYLDDLKDINSFKLLLASKNQEISISDLYNSSLLNKLYKIEKGFQFSELNLINVKKIVKILLNFKLRLKVINLKEIYLTFNKFIDELNKKVSKVYYEENKEYFELIYVYLQDFKYLLNLN